MPTQAGAGMGLGQTVLVYLWPLCLPDLEDVDRLRGPWRKQAVERNRARIRPYLGRYIQRWGNLAGFLYLSGAALEHVGLFWAGVASFGAFAWSVAALSILLATKLVMTSLD